MLKFTIRVNKEYGAKTTVLAKNAAEARKKAIRSLGDPIEGLTIVSIAHEMLAPSRDVPLEIADAIRATLSLGRVTLKDSEVMPMEIEAKA